MSQETFHTMKTMGWVLENEDNPGIYVREQRVEEEHLGYYPLPDPTDILEEFKGQLEASVKT